MSDGLTDAWRMTQRAEEKQARLQEDLLDDDPEGLKRAEVQKAFGKLISGLAGLPQTDDLIQEVRRVWERFEREYGQ